MAAARASFWGLIGALVLREMATRFGRRQLGYLWGLLEPAAFAVVIFLIFILMDRRIQTTMPMGLFLLTGLCPWLLFYRTDNFVRGCVHANIAVLYHPVVVPLHLYISRFILEAGTTLTFAALAFIGYWIIWNQPLAIPQRPVLVVEGACLALAMGLGIGSCLAPLMLRFPGVAYLLGFSIRGLFLTSGIYYIPDYAPRMVRPVIAWNPLTNAIGLFRSGFVGFYPAHMLMPGYTVMVAMTLIFIGLVMERFYVRRWIML
jgi:capsular polysaccharide transport system permease protein